MRNKNLLKKLCLLFALLAIITILWLLVGLELAAVLFYVIVVMAWMVWLIIKA